MFKGFPDFIGAFRLKGLLDEAIWGAFTYGDLLWGKVTTPGFAYGLFTAYIFFVAVFFLNGSSYESESSNIPFLALVYFNAGWVRIYFDILAIGFIVSGFIVSGLGLLITFFLLKVSSYS